MIDTLRSEPPELPPVATEPGIRPPGKATPVFHAAYWDPITQVAQLLVGEVWRPSRDYAFETLQVVQDLSGEFDVDRQDLELAVFAFAVVQSLVDEAIGQGSRAAELMQRVGAGIYHQLPLAMLPEPGLFWAHLCRHVKAYRQNAANSPPSRKFVCIAEQLLRGYGLDGEEDPHLVGGLVQSVSPSIRRGRSLLAESRERIEKRILSRQPHDHELSNPFAGLSSEEFSVALERIGIPEE